MACLGLFVTAGHAETSFSYRDLILSNTKSSLEARIEKADAAAGAVTINGGDSRQPTEPFRFDWGDGKSTRSFFPASHIYADRTRVYRVKVTATYGDNTTSTTEVVVRLAQSPISLGALTVPPDFAVSIPREVPLIVSTQAGYDLPRVLPFSNNAISAERHDVIERVMNAFAMIERDLVNDDLFRPDGSFRQIAMMTGDKSQPYAFSVWFSQPVMFVANESALGAIPDWSSIAHEMGHNFTLNSPAAYRFGGKTDGPANAIVSESLAQIFQHVTCHLLVNHADDYGVPEALAQDIARSALGSFSQLKSANASAPFTSWNDPQTPDDEARSTFMTLAYQFFAAGDLDGDSYRDATKRLMFFLQRFNRSWHDRFSPHANSNSAETFRATMMVAAVSHGVERDMRRKFRSLGFPIDDAVFDELTRAVSAK